MDPHKRHLKKLKRLQDLRKQKLKEKEKVKQKKKSRKSEPELEQDKSEIDVSIEKIEEQSDKTGNELS